MGSPQALWGGGGKQQKEVMPPQLLPRPASSPGSQDREGVRGQERPYILESGPKYIDKVFVILRHRPRQECFSHLLAPKGDCWLGSHMHP